MHERTARYTMVMGNFNAKVGKTQVVEREVGNFGIRSRNKSGGTLVGLAGSNNLKV